MGRGRDDDENRRIQQGMAEGEEVGNLQEKERGAKGGQVICFRLEACQVRGFRIPFLVFSSLRADARLREKNMVKKFNNSF